MKEGVLMQSGRGVFAIAVDFRALLYQPRGDLYAAVVRRELQRRHARVVSALQVGTLRILVNTHGTVI